MQSPRLLGDHNNGKALGRPEALDPTDELPSTSSRAEPGTQNKEPKALEQQAARKTANRFDEFWAVYPVKKGKADAESKWRKKGYDRIADTIIADVKRRCREDRQWLEGYAPHGSTYVNGRGWEDGIEPVREAGIFQQSGTPDYLVGAV
jgi:hypothetical protein